MLDTGGNFHFVPSLMPRKRDRSRRMEGGNGRKLLSSEYGGGKLLQTLVPTYIPTSIEDVT
jgi:hypothetical protein